MFFDEQDKKKVSSPKTQVKENKKIEPQQEEPDQNDWNSFFY